MFQGKHIIISYCKLENRTLATFPSLMTPTNKMNTTVSFCYTFDRFALLSLLEYLSHVLNIPLSFFQIPRRYRIFFQLSSSSFTVSIFQMLFFFRRAFHRCNSQRSNYPCHTMSEQSVRVLSVNVNRSRLVES